MIHNHVFIYSIISHNEFFKERMGKIVVLIFINLKIRYLSRSDEKKRGH